MLFHCCAMQLVNHIVNDHYHFPQSVTLIVLIFCELNMKLVTCLVCKMYLLFFTSVFQLQVSSKSAAILPAESFQQIQ